MPASSQSYAKVTSVVPNPQTSSSLHASHPKSSMSIPLDKSTPKSNLQDGRESNVVLFGVPENRSIVEVKSIIDEIFEFLTGKQIQIKDLFRLGSSQYLLPPVPALFLLSCVQSGIIN